MHGKLHDTAASRNRRFVGVGTTHTILLAAVWREALGSRERRGSRPP